MLFHTWGGGNERGTQRDKCSRLGKLEGRVEVTVPFLQFSVGLKYLKAESQGGHVNEYWEGKRGSGQMGTCFMGSH